MPSAPSPPSAFNASRGKMCSRSHRDACASDHIAVEVERDGGRHQRVFIALAFTNLDVGRGTGSAADLDIDDDLSRSQDVVDGRIIARRAASFARSAAVVASALRRRHRSLAASDHSHRPWATSTRT